jgi:hypothetical protein
MKIDYSKGYFTQEEKEHLNKERALALTKNPNYIPVIVLINSNVLKIDKHKFLVSEDMTVHDYFNSLKKKLLNLSQNDSLVYSITNFSNEKILTPISSDKGCMSLKQLYNQFKDPETNMLILTISRQTTYKWVKSVASYYMGY